MKEKTTVGELVDGLNNGTVSRDEVKAAVAELSAESAVIHRGAEVSQPDRYRFLPGIEAADDFEMEA
jgi:hypothetical protein